MNHKPVRPTVGPRGGRAVQVTPCSECVSWRSCRPGAISEPFGCESWADQEGRRALPDLLEAEPEGPCQMDGLPCPSDMADPAWRPCPFDVACGRLTNPEPATPCEACGGIPSECGPSGCPEVEPERCPACHRQLIYCECQPIEDPQGTGFTFETMTATEEAEVMATLGEDGPAVELTAEEFADLTEPEPFRPAKAYAPDPSRGEGVAQACLPMPDAGPLFAGCPEVRR